VTHLADVEFNYKAHGTASNGNLKGEPTGKNQGNHGFMGASLRRSSHARQPSTREAPASPPRRGPCRSTRSLALRGPLAFWVVPGGRAARPRIAGGLARRAPRARLRTRSVAVEPRGSRSKGQTATVPPARRPAGSSAGSP